MKGVLLAGGTGSRLYPLTRITNKHLLPIFDRPMIAWSIEALVTAGIDEIMLVTGGTHAGEFLRLLGNGHESGLDLLCYGYQERPGGIAEALGLAERFVDGGPVLVMLADNVMERSIRPMVDAFRADPTGLVLVGVGQPVDAELVPVAQQAQELTGVDAAGDQHDLVDTGRDQGLDGPGDHRPVVDGQQVLVGDAGERVQPGAGAPGQEHALHCPAPRWVVNRMPSA